MSGRTIKADDKITLKAPTYNVNTDHYFLVNPPPFNNANTQIMSRNTATGEMQLVDRNSSDFTTDITNAGIHAGLVTNPGFASSHSIKSIAAGSNINVTPGIDHITISTPLDGNITQTNRGIGSHILHDPGTDSSFSFKSLVPGTNMSLSSNDDEITINTTLTGFVSLNNLGAGEHVLADPGTDEHFNFKTIVAGSNITVTSDANTITISNPSGSSITQNNLGAGEPLLVDPGTDASFSFKTLVPGTNTTISSDADTITIGSTLTGNITQSNLGAGTQILSDPGTDNAFAFKTLVAGSNVTLSNDANTVTIAVPTATGTITQSNLGVGAAILSDPGTDNSFAFKTLKGGPNISLSTTANDITIINQLTGEITQTNVGTGSGVLFDTGTSNTFHYKSINAGSNITVTNDPDNIYISTPLDGTITQHNVGSGLQVLKDDGTFSTFNFKTLVAGSGITLTPSTDEITIANSGSMVNVNLTNLGAGQPILTNPGVNSSFAFNTISAGTGILLTPGVGEIIISNDGSAVNVSLDNQTLAGEAILFDPGLNSTFHFKTLLAGTGISLGSDNNSITISTNGLSTITQSNRGAGNPILYDPATANAFSFKTLVEGSHITMSTTNDEITIATDLTGNITQSNLGAGEGIVVSPGSHSTFGFKSLVAGSNVTLASNATEITISAASDGNITQSNLGAGISVLSDPGTDNTFAFRTLVAGTNITVANDANTVTIGSTLTGNITQSNLGAGTQILSDPGTDNIFAFKTLVAGDNMTLTSDANTITITNIHTDDKVTLSNLGTGEAVLSNPGFDSSFAFKTLKAGNNMTVASDANEVTIATTLDGNITLNNLGAGEVIIHDPGNNNHFNLKSLVAGTNIALTSDINTITINNTASGHITQSNLGSGAAILSDPGTDDTFAFKSLVAGNGVTMVPLANDITVSSHVTLNNIGLGFSVLDDPGTDHDFSFKSLLGGTNINLSAVGNDVVINADQQTITMNHLGAGANVLAIPGTFSTFGFKSLVQGTGIVISNGLNDITVSSNISQSNVGVGTGLILKNAGSGPSYEFKSLVAGSGINITNGINDIILASSSTMNNLGAGTGVLVAPGGTITGTTFDFKTLVAGTGITFTTDLTTITINATPFAGITQNNVGAGTGLILKNTGTATSFDFKSLIAGTNVTLTNGTNDITLDVATPNSNLANLGAGTAILATTGVQPVTNVRNFKSLVAGTNLSLSSDANTITINATSSTPDTTLSNLGAGEAVLSTTGTLPATTTRNFKTLLAGTNVTLSSDANSITINSTAVSPTSQGFSVEISNGAVPTIAVNPAYTKIAPFTTPSYGFNSGLLNTGTGVLTIGAGDVGTYNVEFNLMVSNSNATASSKNYIDVIFRNTTTGTNYINLTQDMPSNGNYIINFSKPFYLTAGDYEIQISKLRTGGTYTVYTTLKSGYAVYRIA